MEKGRITCAGYFYYDINKKIIMIIAAILLFKWKSDFKKYFFCSFEAGIF